MGKNKLETTYKWRKDNIKRYALDVNIVTNKDVYEHLEKISNKREYLLELIRKDIKKHTN